MAKLWKVHKFGGTSVANAKCYGAVIEILRGEKFQRRAVVVSAMSKVTDALIHLVELAGKRDESYVFLAEELIAKHQHAIRELMAPERARALAEILQRDLNDLKEILRGVWHGRGSSERTAELVSGYGEIWSAQILAAALENAGLEATWLDARDVLVVEPDETSAQVDWVRSGEKLDQWVKKDEAATVVVTGFVASTREGIPTTLKRNGSDYSASIFGRLLDASEIVIWTDVDGVLSADPRLVPDAVVLREMSYNEATELAFFGAKVVHPNTMAPAISAKIPIRIRNTFKPELAGTTIHAANEANDAIKGFSVIDDVALINVEGTGMMGVPGVAQRLFGALREVDISVVMISQASSEHSICFAVKGADATEAKATVEKAFFRELHHGQIERVDVTEHCSILAAVGDGMVEKIGVSGKFFGAMGRAGINIRAIAQGSSERNISVVIDQQQAHRALRAVHSGFYLSNQTISLGLIGAGLIGGTFLRQLAQVREQLRRDFNVDLRVRGIATSKRALYADRQIDLEGWDERLSRSEATFDLEQFLAHVQVDHLPHTAILDCTTSEEIARHYPEWLQRGIHVITPNKKANSGPLAHYRELKATAASSERHYLYETTVGAGLPIINTLRELIRTGDHVLALEGVLSGTLSYIFNAFDGTRPFSEIVRDAKERGYTEPDPRDDLSGRDVARKLVILAREMGLPLELDQITVENLVPENLRDVSLAQFMQRLTELDGLFSARISSAGKLRYLGRIDRTEKETKVSVGLKQVASTSPFARLSGSDNLVSYRTTRYDKNPLIVQGPGAGPDVTAAGVLSDVLRLSSYLGAHL